MIKLKRRLFLGKNSVLMVISSYHGYGGADVVINNLCKELNNLGYKTAIGAFSFEKKPPYEIEQIKLRKIGKIFNDPETSKFEIIHSHQTLMNYYSLFTSKPFIFHYHGSNGRIQELNLKIAMKLCRNKIIKTIAVSNLAKYQLKKILGTTNAEVIYNGIDEDYSSLNFDKSFKKGEPQLLFVGNLYPTKKVNYLLLGIKELIKIFPKIHLQIVGNGKELFNLKNIIENLSLEEHVELTGRLSLGALKKRYASCDIYVSSSSWEMFGLPLLEAMAFGKPVVASNIPAHLELINNSMAGNSFVLGDHSDFKDKVSKTYQNYKILSDNAVKFAKQHTWKKIAKELEQIYNEILN